MPKKNGRVCTYCKKNYKEKTPAQQCSMKCRLLSGIKIENECWVWVKSKTNFGYGKIRKNKKTETTHRCSYEEFKGKIPKGKIVMHICDNPSCINPKHLKLGTHKENTKDMFLKGRMACFEGSNNSQAKLNKEDIIEIRSLIKNGMTQNEIAKIYKLDQSTVSDIKRKKIWSHVVD